MTEPHTPEDSEPPVDLIERRAVYDDGFTRIAHARLRYRRSNGQLSAPLTRAAIDHGHAVGVLVYDPRADRVVLVRQFRYPVYDTLPPGAPASDAWLLEIVAGRVEGGHSPEETARRELHEEVGYVVDGPLEQIASVYSSPGANTERITLFLAEVDTAAQPAGGGGLIEEGEDTALVALPRAEALALLARGALHDAKTVIALQHLALRLGQR